MLNGMTDTCDHLWEEFMVMVQNPDGSTSSRPGGRKCTKCGKVERS
jgi:hypothetical protein